MDLAKQWQKDEPSSVDGFLLEAEVLQRQDRFAEASVVINKASAIDNSAPVRLTAIRLNLREKKYDAALEKTEALLTDEPYNLAALASYFALKNEQKDPDPAINKIRAAVKDNPNQANLGLLLARIALSINEPEEALGALSRIGSNRQAPPAFWQIKGLALIRNNQSNEALDHYTKWAELYPNQPNAIMGQLLILETSRAYERGARLATDFIARKENLQIQIMQSYFMVMSGNVRGSKDVLASIDKKYHPLPFLRGVKARIALAEGRGADTLEDAIASYQANKTADNLFVYVRSLDAAKQSEVAIDVIQKHTKEFPNDGRARLLLAERQIVQNPSMALASYESLLKDFPNNFVVLNNAAHLLMEAGNLSKAADYAKRAYAIESKNIAIADTYAQVLAKQGSYADALDVYNNVMSDKVTNEEISLNYIEVLFKNKANTIAQRRIKDLKLVTNKAKERLTALEKEYLK
jgi:predicted Zn-dependent protease